MKKVHIFLASAVVAGVVFFACSNKNSDPPDCNETQTCEQGNSSSSSQLDISGSSSSSQPSVGVGVSSSSYYEPVIPGANCSYQPSFCGGMTFDKIKTGNMNETDIGAEDKGQERPNCIYAKTITQIGNESGGISINGTKFAAGSASRCGGDSGHGYGDAAACATKFKVEKADGGYYIYIPAWAGQNFVTTGGEPVCTGAVTPPSTSSSSSGGGGTCVDPMYGLPPNGVKSCVKKGDSCYTCNSDRGKECEQAWIWQVNSVDDYWYSKVDCNESSGGSTPPANTLTCTGLAQTGVAGTAVTQPTVRCGTTNVASPTFTGAPAWNNPTANSYTVSVTANCGGNKTASCGTIVVSAAPTASTLTCTGLATTGVAGTAITQPTVRCGTANATGVTYTGAPSWTNPTANSYTVSASASCGGSNKTASCGTIKVNPKLTCGNPSPTSVIAGTAVTAPTVTCGTATVTNITWSDAPTYWSSPTQGTYNAIKATANAGDCNGQTTTCGTLTVNPKLACGSVTQAIRTGQIPTKPTVTCGTTNVTTVITWTPNINNTISTAQTINTVTAAASCGGSNQTATCSGTITVTASTPSSSSGGTSSGSGESSYKPQTPGTQTAKTTQYWDACKPSCSWSGKGGLQANSCNITGSNIGHNDSDRSACDGGSAFACMNQAPWKVGSVSFGYAAINMGTCGDCYQLDFPNGHVMVVMKSNIGNLNEGAAFDLMIPGGGVGDFDALTRQVTNSGVSNPDMGVRYGGFRGQCGWRGAGVANCVKQKCDAVFSKLPDLRAGCNWYADNLGNDAASFDNPTVKYQKVICPAELTNRY